MAYRNREARRRRADQSMAYLTVFLAIFALFAISHSDNSKESVNSVESQPIDDVSEKWYEKDESLSHEDESNELIDEQKKRQSENSPDVICAKNGMCTCHKEKITVVNCTRAALKNKMPLDTANLRIDSKANFTIAQIVNLDHNDIDILRRGEIMRGQEANILSLDFSFNRISGIEPHAFDNFPKLAKLRLTHNRLRWEEISTDWLTPQLGRSLHQLHLDWNYIEELDDGIFDNLPNLTKLVLDGNAGLRLTPKTFGKNLKKLKTLSLDACGIKELDFHLFDSLESLTELSLSSNPLEAIPTAIQRIPKLSILAMSDTLLNELPSFAFEGMIELKRVYMRRMDYMYSVNDCAFCRLENLELVDFSKSSHLYNIHPNAFGGVSDHETPIDTLQFLYLAECNFTKLDQQMVAWKDLTRLDIGSNPWHCDCDMKWMLGKKHMHFVGPREPTCNSPLALKGVTFLHVKEVEKCGKVEQPEEPASLGNTSMFMVVGLVGVVLVVGFVVVRKTSVMERGREYLESRRNDGRPQLGYANLPTARVGGGNQRSELDDGDQNRLEDDFHAPEFV